MQFEDQCYLNVSLESNDDPDGSMTYATAQLLCSVVLCFSRGFQQAVLCPCCNS